VNAEFKLFGFTVHIDATLRIDEVEVRCENEIGWVIGQALPLQVSNVTEQTQYSVVLRQLEHVTADLNLVDFLPHHSLVDVGVQQHNLHFVVWSQVANGLVAQDIRTNLGFGIVDLFQSNLVI